MRLDLVTVAGLLLLIIFLVIQRNGSSDLNLNILKSAAADLSDIEGDLCLLPGIQKWNGKDRKHAAEQSRPCQD